VEGHDQKKYSGDRLRPLWRRTGAPTFAPDRCPHFQIRSGATGKVTTTTESSRNGAITLSRVNFYGFDTYTISGVARNRRQRKQSSETRDRCLKTKTATSIKAPIRMPRTTPMDTATIKPAPVQQLHEQIDRWDYKFKN